MEDNWTFCFTSSKLIIKSFIAQRKNIDTEFALHIFNRLFESRNHRLVKNYTRVMIGIFENLKIFWSKTFSKVSSFTQSISVACSVSLILFLSVGLIVIKKSV
jgi:hypothetical protein